MYKQDLRKNVRVMREKLAPEYVHAVSIQICQRIADLQLYIDAKHLALYQAAAGEIELSMLYKQANQQGKICYFPVCNEDKTLSFLPVSPETTFIKKRYSIYEPEVDKIHACPLKELDFIVVPLLAFDEKGTRIGQGGGYYDRTLAKGFNIKTKPILVGVAYEFQKQAYIEAASWDVPLAAVITEHKYYLF